MSRYNVITTVMGAMTPLAAGIIVHWFGYGLWLLSALVFLVLSTGIIFALKDPVYYKTYSEYPIKDDLKSYSRTGTRSSRSCSSCCSPR